MKKELPNIFRGEVKNNNNLKVAHGVKEINDISPRKK